MCRWEIYIGPSWQGQALGAGGWSMLLITRSHQVFFFHFPLVHWLIVYIMSSLPPPSSSINSYLAVHLLRFTSLDSVPHKNIFPITRNNQAGENKIVLELLLTYNTSLIKKSLLHNFFSFNCWEYHWFTFNNWTKKNHLKSYRFRLITPVSGIHSFLFFN